MKESRKNKDISGFIISIVFIIVINVFGSNAFFRIDLTSEKRYTLKPITKEILKNLEDVVYLEIYVDGDLPAGLEKFKKTIKEQLEEYKVYAKSNLEYRFVDPYDGVEEKDRNKILMELRQKGLEPVNLKNKDDDGTISEKIIFPGAIIRYSGREITINLLSNNKLSSHEDNLNASSELLEYNFITAINNITIDELRKVVFIDGHGELNQLEVGDFSKELSKYYQIDRGAISNVNALFPYEAAIIAGPIKPFSEKEKFAIDQYIMRGGKVLWLVEGNYVNTDSLQYGMTLGLINNHNLDDQLFTYGVRINPDLIKDLSASTIPVNVAPSGAAADFQMFPWFYSPLLIPPRENKVTKGLDLIKADFISSIDTLANENIKKEVLLSSSEFSRTLNLPAVISLEEVGQRVNKDYFNKSNLPVAVMLSGSFPSVFKGRIVNQYLNGESIEVKDNSSLTKMLVISDVDIVRNEVKYSRNGPGISKMGFDKYTMQVFGNKDFILNAFLYLVDDEGLIDLRAKSLKLRLLDRKAAKENELFWKLLNVLLPVFLVLIPGIIFIWLRKRKYSIRNV